MKITEAVINDLTYKINGAAIEVHKHLGPGLLEGVYHKCLKHELSNRNIAYESELIVPVVFKDVSIQANLRCDLLNLYETLKFS